MKSSTPIFLLFIFLFSINNTNSYCQTRLKNINKSIIKGYWNSNEDSSYSLKISSKQIIESYNNTPIDTFYYELLKYSCDTNYMKLNKEDVLFMKKYNNTKSFCYEVLSLTNRYLVFQYSINAKRLIFRKSKISKKKY